MFDTLKLAVDAAKHIVVIQAENPDGDSLGSSVALEELLENLGKNVTLYCRIGMPKYLRHIQGWDRVVDEFPLSPSGPNGAADLAIIVDTLSDTLLQKTLQENGVRHWLETHPVIAIDHHASVESDLSFPHIVIADASAVATGETIVRAADELGWPITTEAAAPLYSSIMADSLGLTTDGTTADSIRAIARLVDAGVKPNLMEAARRELMKKPADILQYKARLIERIEYFCDGKLSLVHIPWEEIEAYSNAYNPSMLVLDEMRLVEGVEIAVALKTYPDGKVTGKLRVNIPVADKIAGYFGGGGHPYAAGFKLYDSYDTTQRELIAATTKILETFSYDTTI